MLHKLIDFTQTILGTVALTGIIAFSVITVNALNPSINTSNTSEGQVAGITTLPKNENNMYLQVVNSLNNDYFKGTLTYVSENKSTYKLEVPNLSQTQEFEFLTIENLNHNQSTFNISAYLPQLIVNKLKLELLDNVNTVEMSGNKSFIVNSSSQKVLKLRLSPLENVNFPFDIEFEITQ